MVSRYGWLKKNCHTGGIADGNTGLSVRYADGDKEQT